MSPFLEKTFDWIKDVLISVLFLGLFNLILHILFHNIQWYQTLQADIVGRFSLSMLFLSYYYDFQEHRKQNKTLTTS